MGGSLSDEPGPVVAVALNNMGANKLDAFLDARVVFDVGRCPTKSTQRSSIQVSLLNDPPADLTGDNYGFTEPDGSPVPDAPAGYNRLLVQVYAPLGANYVSSTLDGVEQTMFVGSERNRPLWWANIDVPAGQQRTLEVSFDEPTVLGVEPSVMTQAIVNDVTIEANTGDGC